MDYIERVEEATEKDEVMKIWNEAEEDENVSEEEYKEIQEECINRIHYLENYNPKYDDDYEYKLFDDMWHSGEFE